MRQVAAMRCAGAILLGMALAGCAANAPSLIPGPAAQDPQRFERFPAPAAREAYERALDLRQAGDEAAALPLLAEVARNCPDNVLALQSYQDVAIELRGEAERAMREHYERSPAGGSPVSDFAKARLLNSNFARKAAIDELLKAHPDFSYGWMAQGRLSRGVGRLQDAVASFQGAILRNQKLLMAHLELAECLAELGRTSEAQAAYENYLRAAPHDRATVRAYVHLVLYRNDKAGTARPWIERLLAEDPMDESVRMDLAACEWRSGRPDAALKLYVEALERRPDNARAALNIGYLHFETLAWKEEQKREHWPKARAAFLLFLQTVRPTDGHDYFERSFAVPFRLKQIEALLGSAPEAPPTLDDLR
jgi:tetratricopeptide (TPR) repeat protein